MSDKKRFSHQMDEALGETPQIFHDRIEMTLHKLKTQERQTKKLDHKVRWGVVLAAALLTVSALGAAAKLTGVFGFITHTAAKNWVLNDANKMLHIGGEKIQIGECTAQVKEWVCDGKILLVSICVDDPALEQEGHYVPKDEDEDYLAGLENYGLQYSREGVSCSAGQAWVNSYDFEWENEAKNEILYTYEVELSDMSETFTVTFPVSCSEGDGKLDIDVNSADYGKQRLFAPSDAVKMEGYTAQVTGMQATPLHTYAELTLTFEPELSQEERERIAGDYMEGMLVPEERTDVIAGEGEEIAYPVMSTWLADGTVCTIQLRGNPREDYPQMVSYCPRLGASVYDGEGEYPKMSMEGAVKMQVREQ